MAGAANAAPLPSTAALSNDLRFTREFNAAFPGFDTDVHGLVEDDSAPAGRLYYVDCVREV